MSDAPVVGAKNAPGSCHRFTGFTPAFPAQWFYGFLRALAPGRPGFLATLAPEKHQLLKNLTPASGRQNHTTSPYASTPFVHAHKHATTLQRPPHPAPTFVTMANVVFPGRKLPGCLVGMEACGSAHYWAREIAVLGHEVRLIPPAYLKPFVKRGKRSGRRGSYQRSGDPQDHAICSNQDCRAASKCDGAEDPRSSGTAANAVNQRSARTSRRIGHRLRHRSDKDYRADSDRKG